jgi:signal-transduction protein with cAMP-binding, CBS, and nucleotidyltransferase domain
MKVDEVMTKNLVTVSVASMAADAAKKMLSENVGTVLVTDKGQLKGIVTDRQIAARVIGAGKDASKVKVGDFMTKNPVTCSPEMGICEATRIIGENRYRRIPVIERQKPVGIISIADIAEHAKTCDMCMRNIFSEIARAER